MASKEDEATVRTDASNGVVGTGEEPVLETIARALKEIEFGSVLVKIHQGQVVGIETSTKVKFT